MSQEPQGYIALVLATVACKGALLNTARHTACDTNSAPICLCREERDDRSTGFRTEDCGLTVLWQKAGMQR